MNNCVSSSYFLLCFLIPTQVGLKQGKQLGGVVGDLALATWTRAHLKASTTRTDVLRSVLEHWFSFKEAGPQLLMQAFLQRIINGGGRINREYGLGLKRTDLFIEWPIDEAQGFYGPVQRIVIELKLLKKGRLDAVLKDALPQTADYADRCGADEAHIVVFDRRPNKPPEKK